MIEVLKLGRKYNSDIEFFLKKSNNLYFTKDNRRIYVKTLKDFKLLLKECSFAIRKSEHDTTTGIMLVWKSDYLGHKRNYVKFAYDTLTDLDDLLMVLNWKFIPETYVKTEKNQEVVSCFRKKGFKFCTDKGSEILLFRERNDRRFYVTPKEDDLLDE